jgi:osmoprotectant transport system permease protein
VNATSSQTGLLDAAPSRPAFSIDRLGGVIAVLIGVALFAVPFVTYRANRIVSGEGRTMLEALPMALALGLVALSVGIALVGVFIRNRTVRLAAAVLGLIAVFPAVGYAALFITPPDNTFARVSPATGFWVLVFALALLCADSLSRMALRPWMRLVALAVAVAAVAVLLLSGAWNGLSLLKEYANRADSFWVEARQHVFLAVGSLAVAVAAGLPIGMLCHRVPSVRGAFLQVLNIIQTIPSIALFGILMVPLGFLAANVPLAAALGIRGIGAAPAFIALFLYALLPVVANTVVGLDQVPKAVVDAARGMGMSKRQRLFEVELPLAFPIILTGIRIVLVQNLGLATIAALIGGGGFGTFIFQGVGQTAMDLVLLGAIPTVALSFAAAVILDAVIDLTKGARA